MRCPKCDFDSLPGSQFCENCGYNLAGVKVRPSSDYAPRRKEKPANNSQDSSSSAPSGQYAALVRPTAAPVPTVAGAAPQPAPAPVPAYAPAPAPAPAYAPAPAPAPAYAPAPAPAPSSAPIDSEATRAAEQEAARRARAYAALESQHDHNSVYIDAEEVSIGRQTGSVDVSLEQFPHSNNISRRHAKMCRLSEGIFLEDLGSANGTFVNGERLLPQVPRQIFDNDEISFGGAPFIFHWRDAHSQ